MTGRDLVVVVSVVTLAACGGTSRGGYVPTAPAAPSPPPSATSIAPDRGATWRHTPAEIRGTGFQSGAIVTFGGATFFARVIDSRTISVKTPVKPAGTVDVVVTNPDGQRATLAAAYTFEVVPFPTLSPSATTVAPGGPLSITWQTNAPGNSDWIALFVQGTTTNSEFAALWWEYTDGATTGTLTLTAPLQPGQYEFRYLPDDEYTDVARSVVTVGQQ